MPDELKPCPNINCPDPTNLNVGHAGGCWCVSCFCGVRSPAISKEKTVISTREDAIAAWNALPRALQWTEYDGTEGTLPPEGLPLIVDGKDYKGMCFADLNIMHYPRLFLRLGGVEHMFKVCIGDRWMPWPEEK